MNSATLTSPSYRETVKFNKWCEHFFDRTNKETWGNATKSALAVYNTENYDSASSIGHQNFRKLQNLRVAIADGEGYGFGDYWKVAIGKALKGEYSDWKDLGIQLGYMDNTDKKVTAVQNNFDLSGLGAAIANSRKERGLPA